MSAPETKKKIAINLCDITRHNIGQLKLLNKSVLPVQYSEKYYEATVCNWPRDNVFCRLAYHNEYLVGAINARIETYNPEEPVKRVAYLTPKDAMVTQKTRKNKPLKDEAGNILQYRLCITTLCVLPAYRNGQIGTTLIKDVLKTADDMAADLAEIYVHVHVDNAQAVKFYQSFGFEQVGKIEGYYKNDVISPPDCIVLARKTGYKAAEPAAYAVQPE